MQNTPLAGEGEKMSNPTPIPTPTPTTPASPTTPATAPVVATPKRRRKPLPSWAWSIIGGAVAAILFWVARDLLLFVAAVAAGFFAGPVAVAAIQRWKRKWRLKAALAAPTQPPSTSNVGRRIVSAVVAGLSALLGFTLGLIAVWGGAGAVMRYTDFPWEGWMTWTLGATLGSLVALIFGVLGNKLATRLL